MTLDPAAIADRGGIWPVPYTAFERVLLTTQAKYDRRHIPLVWYWRLLGTEEVNGAAPDEEYFETPNIYRQFADPVGVHIFMDITHSQEKKERKRADTCIDGLVPFAISRAEARRVGRLFGVQDDREGLVTDIQQSKPRESVLFVPRAGDLYAFRDRFYVIEQAEPVWVGAATRIISTWKGTATQVVQDMVSYTPNIKFPATTVPPAPFYVPWEA